MASRLDHCVLPTANLGAARDRLTALGFTVAPNGRHPFGTENCCVYFSDGTFLEPLAVADREDISNAIRENNVFVARDAAFRRSQGDEGFSALVFASDDADADHHTFISTGVSAGPMLTFSRPFTDTAGNTGMASFKLAFAADKRAEAMFFFTCQRLNAPAIDRSALQTHANGVIRLRSVECATDADIGKLLRAVSGSSPSSSEDGDVYPVQDGSLYVRNGGATGFRKITFGVRSLAGLEALLTANGVDYNRDRETIIVPVETGQGAEFCFVEVAVA